MKDFDDSEVFDNDIGDYTRPKEWSDSSFIEYDTEEGRKETLKLYKEYFPGVLLEMNRKEPVRYKFHLVFHNYF